MTEKELKRQKSLMRQYASYTRMRERQERQIMEAKRDIAEMKMQKTSLRRQMELEGKKHRQEMKLRLRELELKSKVELELLSKKLETLQYLKSKDKN